MPGGRRPGAPRTREAILHAARTAFSLRGYDLVSLRSVARDAGVDPALVHHFFADKSTLLVALMQVPIQPELFVGALMAGDPGTLGERIVHAVVELWDTPGTFEPFLGLIRAAVSYDDAARLLREFVNHELLGRLAAAIGPTVQRYLTGPLSGSPHR